MDSQVVQEPAFNNTSCIVIMQKWSYLNGWNILPKKKKTHFFFPGGSLVCINNRSCSPTEIHEVAVRIISEKKLEFGQVRQVTPWLAWLGTSLLILGDRAAAPPNKIPIMSPAGAQLW